ncbi:uncharacterized protein LOC124491101 isoform X1 [Dermatophagoides farinae]|uniref:uncharacterized protein LOC124491101 isoform X1 n=1 Tax=Dermatophagoides farinae TaxID=6954 RepID=UPI003F622BF3
MSTTCFQAILSDSKPSCNSNQDDDENIKMPALMSNCSSNLYELSSDSLEGYVPLRHFCVSLGTGTLWYS